MGSKYDNFVPIIDYFVERQCMTDWKLSRNTIQFYDLTYVYKGKATYIVNDKPYILEEGDFIFIPYGHIREAFTDSITPMHCFAFNFRYNTTESQHLELPFPSFFHINDFELLELYKEFSMVWLEKSNGYMLKAKAIFMLIMQKLISYAKEGFDSTQDKRIKLIKDYILKNYRNKIDMSVLAQIVNLNTVYMGNMFKKGTGFTIKEYTNKMRIRAAETLLITGGYSVTEACYQSGFEDPFYFSKVFKKVTGKSPSQLIGRS